MNHTPLRLTPSSIRAFRLCPYSYALGYVQRIPDAARRKFPAMIVGNAVHATIARFLRLGGKRRRGLDEFMAMLPAAWNASDFADPESERTAFEQARNLIERFYEEPYPAEPVRDLGIEKSLAWLRPRRGLVVAGKVDRICLRKEGLLEVVDFKTGRPPAGPTTLRDDPQTLLYRSIAADSFRWVKAARTVVSFRYIGAAVTLTIEYDDVEFFDLWAEIEAVAAEVKASMSAIEKGAKMMDAFPPSCGQHCLRCQFLDHCPAASKLTTAQIDGAGVVE